MTLYFTKLTATSIPSFYWGDDATGFMLYDYNEKEYRVIEKPTKIVHVPLFEFASDQSWEAIIEKIQECIWPEGDTGIVIRDHGLVRGGPGSPIWRYAMIGLLNHPKEHVFADATAAVDDLSGPNSMIPADWNRLDKIEDLMSELRSPFEEIILKRWEQEE